MVIYSMFRTPPFVEPQIPLQKWIKKDLSMFLRIRGLKIPHYVEDIRLAVEEIASLPLAERPAVIEVSRCSTRDMFQCVLTFFVLLHQLFQTLIDGVGYLNLLSI